MAFPDFRHFSLRKPWLRRFRHDQAKVVEMPIFTSERRFA
jgi:hypothetical protein